MSDNKLVNLQAALINQHLVGGTIERAVVGENWGGIPGFGFDVRMPSGKLKTIWVLSDPEGNGPGFLDVAGEG